MLVKLLQTRERNISFCYFVEERNFELSNEWIVEDRFHIINSAMMYKQFFSWIFYYLVCSIFEELCS